MSGGSEIDDAIKSLESKVDALYSHLGLSYDSFYGEVIDDSKKDSSPDQEPPKSIMEQIKESNEPPF